MPTVWSFWVMVSLLGCRPYIEKEPAPSAERFVNSFQSISLPFYIHSDSAKGIPKSKAIDSTSILHFICQSPNFDCFFWSFDTPHLPNQLLKYYPIGRFRVSGDIEALIYKAITSHGLSLTVLGCFSKKEKRIISKIVLSENVGGIPENNHSSWATVSVNLQIEYIKLSKRQHLNTVGLAWFPCLKQSLRDYWSIVELSTSAKLLPTGVIVFTNQTKLCEAREEKGGKLVYPVDPCNDK